MIRSEAFPGFEIDARRAVRFVRPKPGMAVAPVGMRRIARAEENLAARKTPPVPAEDHVKLFRTPDGKGL